jgi:hypothetical protein
MAGRESEHGLFLSSRGFNCLLVAIFVGISTLVAWWSARHSRLVASPRITVEARKFSESPFEVRPGDLNFGRIWFQSNFDHPIVVRNKRNRSVSVNRIITSCDCTSVRPASFELQAGEELTITVAIDLSRGQAGGESRTERTLSSSFTLYSTDGDVETFPISGTVTFPIAGPDAIRITQPVPVRQEGFPERFTVWKDPRISHLSVSVSPEDGAIGEIKELESPISCTFELISARRSLLGAFSYQVDVSGTADDGTRHGPFSIAVIGETIANIEWSPQSVLLLPLVSDSPLVEDIVLSSQEPFAITEAKGPPFVSISMGEVVADANEAGFQQVARITATDVSEKRRAGLILLRGTLGQSAEIDIPITVDVLPTRLEVTDSRK